MAKITKEEKLDKKVAAFLDKMYPEKGYMLVVEDGEKPIYRIPRKTDLMFIRFVNSKMDGIHAGLIAERSDKD